MYTKQVLFIVSLIILVAMFNTAWACHESDTGLRGHNPDLRFAESVSSPKQRLP